MIEKEVGIGSFKKRVVVTTAILYHNFETVSTGWGYHEAKGREGGRSVFSLLSVSRKGSMSMFVCGSLLRAFMVLHSVFQMRRSKDQDKKNVSVCILLIHSRVSECSSTADSPEGPKLCVCVCTTGGNELKVTSL